MAKPFATPEIWNRAQGSWLLAIDIIKGQNATWHTMKAAWGCYEHLWKGR